MADFVLVDLPTTFSRMVLSRNSEVSRSRCCCWSVGEGAIRTCRPPSHGRPRVGDLPSFYGLAGGFLGINLPQIQKCGRLVGSRRPGSAAACRGWEMMRSSLLDLIGKPLDPSILLISEASLHGSHAMRYSSRTMCCHSSVQVGQSRNRFEWDDMAFL